MISEERLRAAAREAGAALDHAPLPEEAHEFSQKYRHTMRQMERHTQRPSWGAGLRRVAVVLLVLLGLGGGWLTVDAQARGVVFGWIRETIPFFQTYSSPNDAVIETPVHYELSVPAGYELIDHYTSDTFCDEYYLDAEGDALSFSYQYVTDSSSSILTVIDKDAQRVDTTVHGNPADLYLSMDPDGSNTIIWTEAATGALIQITAAMDQDELTALAEHVTIK